MRPFSLIVSDEIGSFAQSFLSVTCFFHEVLFLDLTLEPLAP